MEGGGGEVQWSRRCAPIIYLYNGSILIKIPGNYVIYNIFFVNYRLKWKIIIMIVIQMMTLMMVASNDMAYKWRSCHKLLCKLCRTFPPPAMGA